MKVQTTKTILLGTIVLLTILIFVQACEKVGENIVGTFILVKNETKTLESNGKKVDVTIVEFQDSRCPINASCVAQGYGAVTLKLKDDAQEQNLQLCIGGCSIAAIPQQQTIVLNGMTYKLKLEDITPYPTLDKNVTEAQKAKITISN